MNERIKLVRKEIARLNQVDFGARIGITGGAVSMIESGARSATNSIILNICREFGISEQWLRTGEGPMHPEPTAADELAQLLQGASPTKELLIHIIAALPDRDLEGAAKQQALTLVLQVIANTPNHIIAAQLDLIQAFLHPSS